MDTLSVIVLESQLMDRESLAEALAQARAGGLPLQLYLVRNGLVDERDLVAALRRFVLVGEVRSEELFHPQPQAISTVPSALAESFHLVPLRIDDQGNLVVAMSNPTDTHAIDELSYRTGMYVTRLVAPVSAVEEALDRCYRKSNMAGPASSSQPADPVSWDAASKADLVLLTKVKRKRPALQPAQPMEATDVVPLTRVKRRAAKAAKEASPQPTVTPAPSPDAALKTPKPEIHPGAMSHNTTEGSGDNQNFAPARIREQTTEQSPARQPAGTSTKSLFPKQRMVGQPPSNGTRFSPSGNDMSRKATADTAWALPEATDQVKARRKKQRTLVGLPRKPIAREKKDHPDAETHGWQVPGSATGLKTVAFDALRKRLVSCHDPNDVGHALLAYLHNWYGRVLFLVVKGRSLQGRFGTGLPLDTDPRRISLSLGQPSTLGHVVAARIPYQGELPPQGQDGILAGVMGNEGPILLVPISIRSRVVALLCGALATSPIPERELGDVIVLAESQYERILAERKNARPQP